jgi:hypothetical protein
MPAYVYERLQLGVAILNALENRRARTGSEMLHRDLKERIIQRELDELVRARINGRQPRKNGTGLMVNGPGCMFRHVRYKNSRMNLSASHGIGFKEPNWARLEKCIGTRCADFMWMYEKDGVEFYKHIGTRRYLSELAAST